MGMVICLLVLLTLPQLIVAEVPSGTLLRAVVELVSGHSRIFSGESVRLRCSVADPYNSAWDYLWFRGYEQLPQTGQHLVLWKAKVRESGRFNCLGVRDKVSRDIYTLQSQSVEINVDGGWAILQVPHRPGLVGDTLKVTCRVRGQPQLREVILYKDGVELLRQKGPDLYLTNLTREDRGMYSCRASWDAQRRTHSVISAETQVQVLEVLSQPDLEIVADNNLMPVNKIKLICHLQYNAPAPAPPLHYYFYKNNNRLGPATSRKYYVVKRTPGQYSCKAKVPELGLSRWSVPKGFGQVTEPQTMPSVLHPTDPWPLAPPVPSPDLSLPPAAEPTTARSFPHPSTATQTFLLPTDLGTQSSDPLLKPSRPAPDTLLSTVQSLNQNAVPDPDNMFREPVNMSGESGDMCGESGDMSGDMSGESGDMSGDMSDDMSGDMFGDMSGESGDMSGDMFGDMSGESGDMSGDMFGDMFGDMSDDMSGESGDMSGDMFGDMSGDMSDDMSGDMSGESGDMSQEY